MRSETYETWDECPTCGLLTRSSSAEAHCFYCGHTFQTDKTEFLPETKEHEPMLVRSVDSYDIAEGGK